MVHLPFELFNFLNLHYIIRCCLIYEVVEPVGEEQSSVAAPGNHRGLCVVVIREVVFGDFRVNSRKLVTGVLLVQRVGIVFRVTCQENLSAHLGRNGVNPRLVGGRKNFQSLL